MRNRPEALLEVGKQVTAAETLLEGLMRSYVEAVACNRLDSWERAGKSIIELIANVQVTHELRENLNDR